MTSRMTPGDSRGFDSHHPLQFLAKLANVSCLQPGCSRRAGQHRSCGVPTSSSRPGWAHAAIRRLCLHTRGRLMASVRELIAPLKADLRVAVKSASSSHRALAPVTVIRPLTRRQRPRTQHELRCAHVPSRQYESMKVTLDGKSDQLLTRSDQSRRASGQSRVSQRPQDLYSIATRMKVLSIIPGRMLLRTHTLALLMGACLPDATPCVQAFNCGFIGAFDAANAS